MDPTDDAEADIVAPTLAQPVQPDQTPPQTTDQPNGKPIVGGATDDADRCRICRGEGTKAQELFYPCKCNGSIKYVHQSCLVEWLAHSQKKHCELCKTPFRFTKLYDANMPRSVPVLVFLRQAVLHAWKSLLTYGRFHLVVFVWAFWLPWCMRAVWRGLFWLGDGGWVDWQKRNIEAAALEHLASESSGWARVVNAIPAAPSTFASLIMSRFSNRWERQGVLERWGVEYPYKEPASLRLFRHVQHLWTGNTQGTDPMPSTSAATNMTRPSSWLSDVKLLNSLTPSTTVNNIVIDTLEGQIITMFVVVIFIVIFLIREWVMQQQQNILFPAAPENMNVAHEINEAARVRNEDQDDQINRAIEGGIPRVNQAQRILLQPRGRLQRRATHPEGLNTLGQTEAGPTQSDQGESAGDGRLDQGSAKSDDSSPSRPRMPGRGLTSAVEVRRTLDDVVDNGHTSVEVFKDLWSRADKDPAKLLRLIAAEDRSEDLQWIVKIMQNLEETPIDLDQALRRLSDAPQDEAAYPSPPPSFSGVTSSSMSVEDGSRPNTPDRARHLDQLTVSHADRLFPHRNIDDHPEIWHLDSPELINQPLESDSRPTSQAQPNHVLAFPPNMTLLDEPHLDEEVDADSPPEDRLEFSTQAGAVDGQIIEAPLASEGTEEFNAEPWLDRLMRLMWGIPDTAEVDREQPPVEPHEHVVNNIAEEAPFVPVARRQNLLPALPPAPDAADHREAGDAAQDIDGNPIDPLDDFEDMEGFMELIGMQGPIMGLIQNGMFCAMLVSLSISAAIWLPYLFGKGFIIFVARPIHVIQQPLRFLSTSADMIVDFSIFAVTCSYYWTDRMLNFFCSPIGWISPRIWAFLGDRTMSEAARTYAENALKRLIDASMANGGLVAKSLDIPRFSIVAHQSLHLLGDRISSTVALTARGLSAIFQRLKITTDFSFVNAAGGISQRSRDAAAFLVRIGQHVISLLPQLQHVNPLKITIPMGSPRMSLDYQLASWDSRDRSIAVLFGYTLVMLIGMLYLRVAASVKGTNKRGKVEGILADLLYQAGGVTKVILIISIEMIVFPLYCGIILDIAVLPLFKDANVMSRIQFAMASPSTSAFLHWFVGTCYMFHFALFVSMCRKIFRKGVLFFIRDPDDPTFHPVRDVLERNIATQLYKISFSALVYGVLILACLGGVVWSIALATNDIFPIKWTSNEPLIEFPFDLLFYNILIPVAVKYYKPSNTFSNLYGWWYRKCARWLWLSSFLFGEEIGLQKNDAVYRRIIAYVKALVGPAASKPTEVEEVKSDESTEPEQDGKWTQVPYSDQLRIPKGVPTFFEVDNKDVPIGVDQRSKNFLEANLESFTKVHVPPNFRVRIGALTVLIWMFSAALGLSFTLLPLSFGRVLLAAFAPSELHLNDTYAFALGFYLLGGILFASHKLHSIRSDLRARFTSQESNLRTLLSRARKLSVRALSLLYTYTAFSILLPALTSILTQAYIILPLFTFLENNFSEFPSTESNASAAQPPADPSHPVLTITFSSSSDPMINLIQEWTLGLLYTKAIGRMILWSAPSRPAAALRGIIRNGWLNPDAGLATRGFILPCTLLIAILLAFPLACGWITARTVFADRVQDDEFFLTCLYRYSYPAVLGTAVAVAVLVGVLGALKAWRKKVRDEVYLIGERLHNYGESKRKSAQEAKKKPVDKGKGKEKEVVLAEGAAVGDEEQY